MNQISKIMLAELAKQMQTQDITIKYDEKLLTKMSQEGFDPQFGARPLRRYIQDNIEDVLAQAELRDEIKRGNTVLLTTNDDGKIQIVVS